MPPDDSDQSQQVPQYVTPEQLGQSVNAAVTSHLKRINFDEMISKAVQPLIEKLTPPPVQDSDEPQEKKKGKVAPEVAALSAQIEEMKKSLDTERTAKLAAEKSARNDRAYGELRKSLEGKVAPGLLDMVANHLFKIDGRVLVSEDGTATFKTTKPAYYGSTEMEEVEMPIEAGVSEYLKSDAAKAFLPAPSMGGGSNPLPKRAPLYNPGGHDFSKPATSDEDKVARAMEREQIAIRNLSKT